MSGGLIFHQQLLLTSKFISPASVMKNHMKYYSDTSRNFSKYYKILNIPEDCDQEQLRQAYLALVKRFHPDSGSSESNAIKFQEVENAYRNLQKKMSMERWNHHQSAGEYGLYYTEKEEEFDIKHTAPQHRQYLTFGGYGVGTPQQREKQYYKYRAIAAAENVYKHRVEKLATQNEDSLIVKDKKEAKKIKTRYGIERLVEDLIQESMAKGEFDNLKGTGKPLPHQNYNPYVDFVTHKINQVLIENGFTPEWITLQRDIKEERAAILNQIMTDRALFGPKPLTSNEAQKWNSAVQKYESNVKELNSKIIKFNLLVPLLKKQMFLFDLDKEADKALEEGNTNKEASIDKTKNSTKNQSSSKDSDFQNVFALLGSIFR